MISRRALLAGSGAALAATSLPAVAESADRSKPPRLRRGDRVGLIAPASAVSLGQIERAQFNVRGMGLRPRTGKHAYGNHGYLAGTDQERASDINAMFADPEIRAVFAISGGWGCARLLPLLDWPMIRANPKLLIGYSDITALHCAFAARAGFPTIHAPNAGNRWGRLSWRSLVQLGFVGATPVLGGQPQEAQSQRQGRTITGGRAAGKLLGGNLTILSTLMGTPWMPDMSGAILFAEDVREAPYRIDRMFQQLRLAGVLESLGGVVFGQCTRCTSRGDEGAGFSLDEIVEHHL